MQPMDLVAICNEAKLHAIPAWNFTQMATPKNKQVQYLPILIARKYHPSSHKSASTFLIQSPTVLGNLKPTKRMYILHLQSKLFYSNQRGEADSTITILLTIFQFKNRLESNKMFVLLTQNLQASQKNLQPNLDFTTSLKVTYREFGNQNDYNNKTKPRGRKTITKHCFRRK